MVQLTCADAKLPIELAFLIFTFLEKARSDNKVQVKVTGWRRLENGLVVPGSFLARTKSRAIAATKFDEEIIRLKNLCTHINIRPLFCNVVLLFVCEQLR